MLLSDRGFLLPGQPIVYPHFLPKINKFAFVNKCTAYSSIECFCLTAAANFIPAFLLSCVNLSNATADSEKKNCAERGSILHIHKKWVFLQ